MYDLPTSVEIKEKTFKIREKGSFKMVLDCFNALNDMELKENERVATALVIFYEDINDVADLPKLGDIEEACKKMEWFFNCGKENIGMNVHRKVMDWEEDSDLIFSAINNVAKKEVRAEEYIHWWTFMGYYLSIGECPLATIINIRTKIAKNKKLEKYEREFRRDNPQYFKLNSTQTIQEKEIEKEFLEKVWNK